MPFTGNAYSRFKTFINTGTLLPSDLNSIQDELGAKIGTVADTVDLLNKPRVSSLPTTGLIDGMVVPWQTALAKSYGVTWLMKYNAGQPYPWECIGGEPMHSWVEGSGKIGTANGQGNPGAFAQLDASNVQDLPIPYEGEWKMEVNIGYAENSAGNSNFIVAMPARLSGANQDGASAVKQGEFLGSPYGVAPYGAYGSSITKVRSVICTASSTVGVRYQATQNYANFYGIFFSLKPVRVKTG